MNPFMCTNCKTETLGISKIHLAMYHGTQVQVCMMKCNNCKSEAVYVFDKDEKFSKSEN